MTRWLRTGVLWFVFVVILPMGMSARALYRGFGSPFLFDLFAQQLSLAPGRVGQLLRACYYRQTLRRAYLDLDIGFGSLVSKMETTIGRRVLITGKSTIGLCDIGDGAVIANYVSILSGRYQHNLTDPSREILEGDDVFTRVRIGAGSFIGEKSVVMADVGERTIVGAGSVVVAALPPYVVAVGNPARVVKERRAT
jgi:acetyltransferase-like isoleucine patch superfamily enzyme